MFINICFIELVVRQVFHQFSNTNNFALILNVDLPYLQKIVYLLYDSTGRDIGMFNVQQTYVKNKMNISYRYFMVSHKTFNSRTHGY